jgi:hypothetical protein
MGCGLKRQRLGAAPHRLETQRDAEAAVAQARPAAPVQNRKGDSGAEGAQGSARGHLQVTRTSDQRLDAARCQVLPLTAPPGALY